MSRRPWLAHLPAALIAVAPTLAFADAAAVTRRDPTIAFMAGGAFVVVVSVVWAISAGREAFRLQKDLPRSSHPFLPFEQYAFECTVRPEEIVPRLFDNPNRTPGLVNSSRATTSYGAGAYWAKLSDDAFTLYPPHRSGTNTYKNPYVPVVVGVVQPGPSGSTVRVTFRLHWLNIVPVGLIAATWLLAALQSPLLFVPFVAVHGGLYLFGWMPERAKALAFLIEALPTTGGVPHE
jgi:hypothetical protein